ncbi:MAG: toll/interleukin-1 receptor domain-containing protein [Vicinamibacterales bacterium]
MTTARTTFVLVMGTGFANAAKRRAARLIGGMLADAGFGLVTGNSTGVDYWVARSFCDAIAERGGSPEGAVWQVSLGASRILRRGGWPLPGFAAPRACRVAVTDVETWKREAVSRADAGVMVGGGRGALDIARRMLDRGRPVFPLPFMGGLTGNSDEVFQDILRTWEAHPVPGVSRSQYLRLAEPWVSGTGELANLLRGTLAERPDIFVSYRRSDAPAAAGRIAHELAEHFGSRRVFFDVSGIAPSHAWDETIRQAVDACAVGVVVIGRSWLARGPGGEPPRLHQPNDVVRGEIEALIAGRKVLFPVVVEGARLPDAADLPESLAALPRFQAVTPANGDWDVTIGLLVREIEAVLHHPDRHRRPPP